MRGEAVPRFNTDPIEPGMFVLAPPAEPGIPFSLAEVLRVVDGGELRPGEPPYLMVNLWKVKLAETHGGVVPTGLVGGPARERQSGGRRAGSLRGDGAAWMSRRSLRFASGM